MFNKEKIEELQRDIEWLTESEGKIHNKLNNLYKNDNHGTERPKVDILSDDVNHFMAEVWKEFSKLQRKVEELEVLEATRK